MKDWGPLDLSCDGIVLLDQNQVATAANAPALEFLCCMLPAVTGRDFWQVVPPEVATQHQIATHQHLASAEHHSFTVHHTLEDRWVEYIFRRHPAGFVVNLRDADAVQRLQHLLDDNKRYNRMIFEANPNAMWVFDRTSRRIFSVNQAAISFYAIPRKVFMSLKMEALFPEGEGAELLNSLKPGKDGHQAPSELRLCKQRKMNGQEMLVELAWSLVNWDGHQAVLVSLADISQRHLADSALRRANAALEQALQTQQAELKRSRQDLLAFTQAVSSDLQDSLHVAHGFAARLAEKYSPVLDEPGRHYVRRIQASISLLAKLLDDLRTLAQLPLRAGAPEPLDLALVCHKLVAALRKEAPQRNVTIEMEDSLPLVGSRGLLVTVMGCLLENAWKFTSKKAEAWIKVELLQDKSTGEMILRIADNGAGFDASYSGQLFTAFQRLHSSADFPGNGLGLAIVKRAAELQGGRVWAESDPTGASFFMALPQAGAVVQQERPE
ncbi:MAG: ATP-binding protein [Pseudomonadota bacterium]|nr:ATP-binding protein [Pseudomonadota bacterium]